MSERTPYDVLAELVARGRELLAAGDPASASRMLAEALESAPEDRSLRADLARAYADSAQLGRAETAFAELVEADPTDAWARRGLGRVMLRRGRPQDALPQLRMAYAMSGDPDLLVEIDVAQARMTVKGF